MHKGRSYLELKTWQDRVGLVELRAVRVESPHQEVVGPKAQPQPGDVWSLLRGLLQHNGLSSTNPVCVPLSPPAPWRHPNHCPGFPLCPGFYPCLPVCLAKAGRCRGSCSGPQVPLSILGLTMRGRVPALPQAPLSTRRCPLGIDRL